MSVNVTYNISNVKCAGCVGKIESRLKELSGISSAQVNLLDKTVMIEYDNNKLEDSVREALDKLGYPIEIAAKSESVFLRIFNIVTPIILGAGLMVTEMLPATMLDYSSTKGFIVGLFYALITLLVVMLCGKSQIKSGILGIRNLSPNMYTLIVLGVFSAWLYSLFIVVMSHNGSYLLSNHVYFESALVIIGLVNLGSFLEDRAKNAALGAIKGLSTLIPATAIVIINQEEKEIASNLLRTGYIIRIKPGMKLPADGEIRSGEGYLEEAMLTGEPLPVHKRAGDKVFGGTINISGAFEFSVSQVGGDTLLGDIIAMVKTAQMAKPPLAKIADKIARIFVPTVMLLALLSGLTWYFIAPENNFYYALTVFMTVLIIACPCSVGLAIPVSLTVGVGRAAKSGIIIRDPSVLGHADKIDIIILDKTGTLTIGKPSVVDYVCNSHINIDYSLQILKALEKNSEHPLAHAILNYRTEVITDGNLNLESYKTISGKGVSGVINGAEYFAGSLEFIRHKVAKLTDDMIEKNRYTNIYLANADGIIARVDISDELKPDAKVAIADLSKLVSEIILLTGDNESNAKVIATEAGITKVVANCLPQDKLAFIKAAQEQGKKVLFVGDGINDAPSLVQADLGIAVAGGTDVASSSAAICLTGTSLSGISDALKMAQAINRNMRQNLFGSFIYNSLAILLAMGVFYPFGHHLLNPMVASVAMSLSSVTVILNALRLRTLNFSI